MRPTASGSVACTNAARMGRRRCVGARGVQQRIELEIVGLGAAHEPGTDDHHEYAHHRVASVVDVANDASGRLDT
jgi:hypothetical protein